MPPALPADSPPAVHGSAQFLITLDRAEKARWKKAADEAGLSMAEYVRRAVAAAEDAPTPDEIGALKAVAAEIRAMTARAAASLDRTIARIEAALDPEAEAKARNRILRGIAERGEYLDLAALGAKWAEAGHQLGG